MTQQVNDKITRALQFFNTAILTIIGIYLVISLNTINKIQGQQVDSIKDRAEMRVQQDINKDNIKDLDIRVTSLETLNERVIKDWVETNFIRKSQKN
jgi:hypothetical protein